MIVAAIDVVEIEAYNESSYHIPNFEKTGVSNCSKSCEIETGLVSGVQVSPILPTEERSGAKLSNPIQKDEKTSPRPN